MSRSRGSGTTAQVSGVCSVTCVATGDGGDEVAARGAEVVSLAQLPRVARLLRRHTT